MASAHASVTESPRSTSPDLYQQHVLFCSSMNHPAFLIHPLLNLLLMNHIRHFKVVPTNVRLLAVFDITAVMVVHSGVCSMRYFEKRTHARYWYVLWILVNVLKLIGVKQISFLKGFSGSVAAAVWDCCDIIYHLHCLFLSFYLTVPSGRAIKDSFCGRSAGLFCQTIFQKGKKEKKKKKKSQLIKNKLLIDHVRTRRNEKAALNLPLEGIQLKWTGIVAEAGCLNKCSLLTTVPAWAPNFHIWWAFFA